MKINWKDKINWIGAIFAIGVLLFLLNRIGVYFGLDKSDWASWVQAVGSIGAIVGAVWVMGKQHQIQARDRLLGNTLQASVSCDAFCSLLNDALLLAVNEAVNKGEDTGARLLAYLQRGLQGTLVDMASVQLGDMRYEDALIFANAKRHCRVTEHVFTVILLDKLSFNDVINIVKEQIPVAENHAQKLRNNLFQLRS